MKQLRAVKGMHDLFEEELATWRRLEAAATRVFLAFGYGEIRTPVLEETALFVRGVGESTDIVTKEMYAFEDKDKHRTSLCLRPENTAGVVRALVQNGRLPADAEAKAFYLGPMFRRERPAKGRFRQFFQLGAEAFGLSAPTIDVEMMSMLHCFLEELGLSGVRLVINSLGDEQDRPAYSEALRSFFADVKDELCGDCQRRLEDNPLRILDCKVESCRALAKDAPTPLEHLGDDARKHFDDVQTGLSQLGVPYEVGTRLVRGLDYYTRTVFEALADIGLGAQNAVAAGGRYDNLVETLGGRPTPGIGFAAGIERLVLLLSEAGKNAAPLHPQLMLIGADDGGRAEAQRLAYALRRSGVRVEIDHRGRSVKAQMKRADRAQAAFSMVLGQREVDSGSAELKQMSSGDVQSAALTGDAVAAAIRAAPLAYID